MRAQRSTSPRPTPLFHIDMGWLPLLPGVALLAMTTLAPAWVDLAQARHTRDTTLTQERWLGERNDRARRLLGDLDAQDPALLERLASVQHNALPDGRATLPGLEPEGLPDADVRAWITPPRPGPTPAPVLHPLVETLAGFQARLWLVGLGGGLVLAGLLGWIRPERAAPASVPA